MVPAWLAVVLFLAGTLSGAVFAPIAILQRLYTLSTVSLQFSLQEFLNRCMPAKPSKLEQAFMRANHLFPGLGDPEEKLFVIRGYSPMEAVMRCLEMQVLGAGGESSTGTYKRDEEGTLVIVCLPHAPEYFEINAMVESLQTKWRDGNGLSQTDSELPALSRGLLGPRP